MTISVFKDILLEKRGFFMSKTFKIVLVLLVVASVVSAGLAVVAFMGKEREYVKRLLLEDKLAATLKDKRRLEKEIDSNKKAKEEIEAKILEMEASVKELSLEAEEAKANSETAVAELALKEKEVEKFENELVKERKEKLAISKKLEDMEFDFQKAKADVTRLKSEKTRLEKKLSDLKESSVDLDTIVVKSEEKIVSPLPAPVKVDEALRGRVLVVNKEYDFIVTDLGQDDGIEKGMVFKVMDGATFLGKVEINKIYDTMSSASVLPGGKVNNMKKGNLIIESR